MFCEWLNMTQYVRVSNVLSKILIMRVGGASQKRVFLPFPLFD
jgi:hypothetical protein